MTSRVVIIKDEALLVRNMTRYLARLGHEVTGAGTVAEGLRA